MRMIILGTGQNNKIPVKKPSHVLYRTILLTGTIFIENKILSELNVLF